MSELQNPLQKHFRSPSIFIKLPSQGEFWPDNSLMLSLNGELGVYPMTTKDEIMIRTPDALLNGNGVVSVIQSCIPSIKDAWKMPATDVDAALIAIRIASYGNFMEVDTKCPHCEEENTYNVDLHPILSAIATPDFHEIHTIDGLSFKFKPRAYFELNKTNLVNFEEQKLIDTIRNADLSDSEKTAQFTEHLLRLVDLTNQLFVDSTEYIQTAEGVKVTEPAFINDYYKNSGRKITTQVKEILEKHIEISKVKPVDMACSNCKKSFKASITFDHSNFFA